MCLAQTRGSEPDLATLVPPCGHLWQSWTLFQSGDDGPLHPRYRHPQFAFQKVSKGLKFYHIIKIIFSPSTTCFFNPYDPLIGLVSWNSPPCSGFCSMIVVEKADSSKCQACWSPLRKILIEQAPRGSALCCSQWPFLVHFPLYSGLNFRLHE